MAPPFTQIQGSVRTTVRLNLRESPSISAAIKAKVEPNSVLKVTAHGKGDRVSGNDDWYQGDNDLYFWSGGCSALVFGQNAVTPVFASVLHVNRRPNGTILPLEDGQRSATFGAFPYTEGVGGRIVIAADWIAQNIVSVQTPIMAALGFPSLKLHRLAQAPFQRALDAIGAAGLAGGFLTCAGTFVPRHKGWNPARGLSPHSWGIAIDVNAEWNGYGHTAAALDAHGSCRQFIPYFEAEGFAWGGYFSSPYQDGMHFELARYDLA